MRKVIAAINVTLDGICDHTAVNPDADLHQHYADLLAEADVCIYGRVTYHLMEYWRSIAEQPTGEKATNGFAVLMDRIPKLVFSRTVKELDWHSARLAQRDLADEVAALMKEDGRPILVGSPSMIVQLINLGLVDELQLCIHPLLAAQGKILFSDLVQRRELTLFKTKTFNSGAMVMYYNI